jgi:hypothetical protein
MPDTTSIGLGGGSRVRKHADGLVVNFRAGILPENPDFDRFFPDFLKN